METFYDMDTEKIIDHFTVHQILGDWEYSDCLNYADGPCLLYLDSIYVELLHDEYDLVIGNMEWTSQCLHELEIRLARFAVEEGIIDRDEFLTRMDEELGRNIGVIPEEYRGNDYGNDE